MRSIPWTRELVVTALVAATLAGCSRGAEHGTQAAASAPPVAPVSAQGVLALAKHSGARATLVNVWATWCLPCREEFPALLQVARAHERDGLKLVLVSADFDDQLPGVRSFLAAHAVTDTSYIKADDDQSFINTLNPQWSGALPATFVYDADGNLATFWEGMADESRFRTSIEAVLAPHATTKESRP